MNDLLAFQSDSQVRGVTTQEKISKLQAVGEIVYRHFNLDSGWSIATHMRGRNFGGLP